MAEPPGAETHADTEVYRPPPPGTIHFLPKIKAGLHAAVAWFTLHY
jgi:hypothetical protein